MRKHFPDFPIPAGILAATALLCIGTGCAPRYTMSVLIKMIKDQEDYFRQSVIPGFDKEHHGRTLVEPYTSTDSIEFEMNKRAATAGLVKVPFDKAPQLVREGRIKALDDFLAPAQIAEFNNDYLLTSLAKYNDKHYYVPRKFETRIMVYCKSKVSDALASWRKFKPAADSALKAVNGYGFPSAYALEEDPNQWDYFDIFMVGWVWSHTPYGGVYAPRIAHRGMRYSGTSLGLVDMAFQCRGDSTDVLSMRGDALTDVFFWESLYAWGGIFTPRMWTEAWSGTGIWKGIKEGAVYLSFMTQLDCFFIHGTGRDGLEGYLDDPDDMGVAVMPQGCSVELDKNGSPVRRGVRSITTGGWWWGIPAKAANPAVSYALARYITSNENQIQESNRFGMIPVRKDILSDISMMFGGAWIKQVYRISFQQLMNNKFTIIPANPHYNEISTLYLDAWYMIVAGGNWSADRQKPDREYIRKILESVYAPKAGAMLSR